MATVRLVIDDLLHSPAGADAESLQFDLGSGNTVDQEHHVVAMVAVFGVDTELVNDLEGVFTPVLDIDEGVVKGVPSSRVKLLRSRSAVAYIRAIGVFKIGQCADQCLFQLLFGHNCQRSES